MESPSAQLPAREVLSAAILRNYTRVGDKARRAPFGFATNRRGANPPGCHFRRRGDSLRITEEGTGQAARMRGRPLWFTDGVVEGDSGRIISNSTPYMACANIMHFSPDPRILSGWNFRTERLQPSQYREKLATSLQKTHNQHVKVRNFTEP